MEDVLTWEQIQEKYPNQWVGLVNVKYMNNDGVTIEEAVVKYTDKSSSELTHLAIKGEIVARYTTPDSVLSVGMIGWLA